MPIHVRSRRSGRGGSKSRTNLRVSWIVFALTLTATAALLLGGCTLLQGWLISPDDGISLITESEAQAILDTQQSAAALYKELVDQGATRVGEQVAEWLRTIPGVAQVVVGDDGNVWITYDSGLVGVLLSERNTQSTTAELQPTHLDVPFAQETEPPESLKAASPLALQRSQVQLPGSRRAVILAYNKEFYDENGGKAAYEALEAMGYTVERYVGEGFTLDRLTGLDAYGVIFFFTHGGLSKPAQLGFTDTIVLSTGQRVSGARELAQLWRRYPGAIGLWDLSYFFNPRLIPRFITDMMLELPDSLVVAQACYSLKNDSMADAFLRQGAAAYLGWTDVSNGYYTLVTTVGLLKALARPGCTVSDGLVSQVIDFMPGRETESYSIDQLFPAEYCWFDQDNGAYHFLEIDLRIVGGDLSLCKCWTTDFKLKLGEAGDLMLVEPDPVILTLYVHEGSVSGPVISRAKVSGTDAAETSFDQVTSDNGYVTLVGAPGEWSIRISKTGYATISCNLEVSSTGVHREVLQRSAQPTPDVAAAITWMSVPTAELRVGEAMTLDVTVENTGSSNWTYQVAASLRRPGGSHVHLPLKPLTLSPGESGSVVWTYSPDSAGSWDLVFGVWKEVSQQTSLDTTGWMNGFFSVTTADVTSVAGTWTGTKTQTQDTQGPCSRTFWYQMTLYQEGERVWGTSRIEVPGSPQYYAVKAIEGEVIGSTVILRDIALLEDHPRPNQSWCMFSSTLAHTSGAAGRSLNGPWIGLKGCAGHTEVSLNEDTPYWEELSQQRLRVVSSSGTALD